MKTEVTTAEPETNNHEEEEPPTVSGDVIGDTAYSERFVLKILLKFANLDTLKEEINEKPFEEDLCTLWDMTAERDVVKFLQKHNILNLLQFALPNIDSPRILEIAIGIIGNMCCQKEVVSDLAKSDNILSAILEHMKSDDSLVLIQVLRLVNSGLYLTDEEDVSVWLDIFEKTDFPSTLFYILQNSANKDLLVSAMENFNTVCSYCNKEKFRDKFFTLFVKDEALISLSAGFTELIVVQRDKISSKEDFERLLVINLQIILNLAGFDKAKELFEDFTDSIVSMIDITITYYENKLVSEKEMDTDLVDVVESIQNISSLLDLDKHCCSTVYFEPCYNIWKTFKTLRHIDPNGSTSFEEDDKEELRKFVKDIKKPLCFVLCKYMEKCSPENIVAILDDVVGADIDSLLTELTDEKLRNIVLERIKSHRERKEKLDT